LKNRTIHLVSQPFMCYAPYMLNLEVMRRWNRKRDHWRNNRKLYQSWTAKWNNSRAQSGFEEPIDHGDGDEFDPSKYTLYL